MTLLLIALAALAAWVYLLVFRHFYWRASERLEPAPAPASWPPVAGVIPARNEAETIRAVLAAHARAEYPGPFSVTLVDDHSEDGTGDLARRAGENGAATDRIAVIPAPALPAGWSGKLNALAAGVAEASREETPKYFLFTDADIVLAPTTLKRLVAHAEANDLALASLMARLDARGVWGGLLIPAFVYFFQKLYPFPAANDPASPLAAAAGGCMLVRADTLAAAGGIEAIKGDLIDDCALADILKNARLRDGRRRRIWLGLASDEATSLRDNRTLGSIWNMVARTAFTQLRHSWALLAGAVAAMGLIYLAPPMAVALGVAGGNGAAAAAGGAAWLLMAASYFPTARLYGLPAAATFALPAAALLYMMMTVSSALRHARGRGGRWKGRTYSA